jgi:hypothetical protein
VTSYLTTARNEPELDAICGRLADAGIRVLAQGALDRLGVPFATSRDIYVNDDDLERARQVLSSNQDFDEDELARLSEQSYREATGRD